MLFYIRKRCKLCNTVDLNFIVSLFGAKLGFRRILDSQSLRRVLAVFTRSAIIRPKVNWFGWNLEHAEYVIERWTWQILGAIRAVATAREPDEILFLSGKQRTILPISRRPNFTTFEHNTSIGVPMKTFGTEFWKFYREKLFFQKKNQKYNVLRLQATKSVMITDRRKFITKITLYGTFSFHFYRSN